MVKVRDKEGATRLLKEKVVTFHRTMAQLLFLGGMAQTAVAFLTTRAKVPDKDNWCKIKEELKYLNGTKDLGLALSIKT